MTSNKPREAEGVAWREVGLGEICQRRSENIIPIGKNQIYIGLEHINSGEIKLIRWDYSNKVKSTKYKFYPGDILYGKLRPYLDKAVISDKEGICSTDFIVLTPLKTKVLPFYLIYFLHTKSFVNYSTSMMKGVHLPRVSWTIIKKAKIPLPFRNGKPDLETQKKIVEYIEANFSRIDKILEKKKKELEQLDELWESILEQAFKPKEGEEWREVRLGEVCIINPKKSEVKRLLEQNIEVSFIPMDYVDDTEGKIVKQKIRSIRSVYKGYTYFKEGDVLFAKITPCMENGKTAVAYNLKNKIGFGSTEFHVLRPKESILSDFIFYFVRRKKFRNLAKLHFTGTVGHKRVPKEFLINSKIPLPFRNNQPDIEKQKEIANYLDSVYEKIKTLKEKIQRQISLLEEMKESILDEVFNHGG